MPPTIRRLLTGALGIALLMLAAACTENDSGTTPTTPSCTITVGTVSLSSFGATGGTGSVSVTAAAGCAWTATSSATFVTITGGAGSGNGTATFSVAVNTGGARSATLTVGGTSFTITQNAAAVATPGTLSAPIASSPIGGQSVTETRPTLVVNNATASGNIGTTTYRFEISDLSTFPSDAARTFTVDGVAQGPGGSTSWTVSRDLGPDVLWYWHARATDGTVTSAYSNVETFRTASACSFTVSPTSASAGSSAGTVTISVTSSSTCAWTATSNDSFITVTSGASGTGSGSVIASVTANTGAARTGTVTVAGQTVTISQSGGNGIVASFQMFDPAAQSGATTECRFRSATTASTTCTVQSNSFTLGTTTIVNYAWTVAYTYNTVNSFISSGSSPSFSFTDTCGKTSSTADGISQPLSVTLTVTDSAGNTATVTSGSGNQPALVARLYTCGS